MGENWEGKEKMEGGKRVMKSGRGGPETVAGGMWGESWEEISLPCKRKSSGEQRQRRREKRGMEGCDDGCAALVSCPLTKTLISVCVIPHCLLRLLILINYIHLPLPPSIPFSRPPSLCPPKITYWLSEPHLDQTCFYLLTISLSLPLLPATRFYSPFLSILSLYSSDVSLPPCFFSTSPWKNSLVLFFFCSVSLAADCVSACPA